MFQIRKTDKDIKEDILENVTRMLTNRGLMDLSKLPDNVTKARKMHSDVNTFNFDVVKGSKYFVKIYNQKLTSISKATSVSDFLSEHKNDNKIIIVNEVSKKAQQHIHKNYPNTEIFAEHELLIDLVSHELVPEHIPLSEEEGQTVMELYNVTKRQMPKMLSTDPVARYYNMKAGQVVRIIPPSYTAGKTVYYRMVR